MGCRVKDLGFGVWGLGFRVYGLGFRVYGLGFRVEALYLTEGTVHGGNAVSDPGGHDGGGPRVCRV